MKDHVTEIRSTGSNSLIPQAHKNTL